MTEIQKIRKICCECGDLIHDGILIKGRVSHGYCPQCYSVIIAFIEGRDYDKEYAKKLKTISV